MKTLSAITLSVILSVVLVVTTQSLSDEKRNESRVHKLQARTAAQISMNSAIALIRQGKTQEELDQVLCPPWVDPITGNKSLSRVYLTGRSCGKVLGKTDNPHKITIESWGEAGKEEITLRRQLIRIPSNSPISGRAPDMGTFPGNPYLFLLLPVGFHPPKLGDSIGIGIKH